MTTHVAMHAGDRVDVDVQKGTIERSYLHRPAIAKQLDPASPYTMTVKNIINDSIDAEPLEQFAASSKGRQ